MYVIKFNNGLYWAGYNNSSTQLRKAIIYNSIEMARKTGEDCLARKECIRPFATKNKPIEEIKSFTIVEVEIREVEDVKD